MTKKPYRTAIIVIAILSVLLTVISAFSVSYAKWISPNDSTNFSVSVYIPKETLTDEEIQEIKDQLGGGNNPSGIVTGEGGTAASDADNRGGLSEIIGISKTCTITLKAGETFFLCVDGTVITSDTSKNDRWQVTNNTTIVQDGTQFIATEDGTYTITMQEIKFFLTFDKIITISKNN